MTGRQASPEDRRVPTGIGATPARPGLPGVMVAGVTALISGLSIFVNSYGVHAVTSPSVYTTAKNLVATAVLGGCALGARLARRHRAVSAIGRFVTVQTVGTEPRARPGGRVCRCSSGSGCSTSAW